MWPPLVALAVISISAFVEDETCPNLWDFKIVDNRATCTRFFGTAMKKSWFQSEAHCRSLGSHLATAESKDTLKALEESLSTHRYSHTWFGLRLVVGDLKYSSGVEFGDTRNVLQLPAFNESDKSKNCLSIRADATSVQDCSTLLPFTCTRPANSELFRSLQLFILNADFGESDPTINSNVVTRITADGLVIHRGAEIGLGKWVTDTTFVANHPAGFRCIWRVNILDMTTGCDRGRRTVFQWLIKPKWRVMPRQGIGPSQDDPVLVGVPVNKSGEFMFGSVQQDAADDGFNPPVWVWSTVMGGLAFGSVLAVVGGVRKKKRGKKRSTGGGIDSDGNKIDSSGSDDNRRLREDSDEDLPYTLSAINTMLHSFDENFSGNDYNESDSCDADFIRLEDGDITVPHSVNSVLNSILDSDVETGSPTSNPVKAPTAGGSSTGETSDELLHQKGIRRRRVTKPSTVRVEDCEICKKFDKAACTSRLHGIHRSLAAELKASINITDISCEHVGNENNDHIHTFKVNNEFSLFMLGILSTSYARAKPRLSRNIRIHILHNRPPGNE
eukprot:TRINITY_DN3709_c0_g2_i1.p1 TRINITY_DN3709_c0_g2~~TRINITY_DN3709_c0_g2_i1.p1  ORF type:complete len:558 (+),score=86.60 TRINITY_DN3709_c0_g2_i1:36-1709(+)